MEKHITFVAILNITLSVLGLLFGGVLFAILVVSGLISGDPTAIGITTLIGVLIGFFFLITSIPGIIGGIGLLKHKSWARILLLIVAVLDLFNIPIGTVAGIYTIWVLMQEETMKILSAKNPS